MVSVFRLCQIAAVRKESAGGGAILSTTSMSGDNWDRRMGFHHPPEPAECRRGRLDEADRRGAISKNPSTSSLGGGRHIRLPRC